METLEKIAPAPLTLTVAGESLTISPIKTRELPRMLKAVKPIAAEIQSGDVVAALMANADCLVEAVAIGARKPRAWVDELDLDDLVMLASAVLEVNGDFFVRAVLPGAIEAMDRVSQLIGQRSSMPSSAADTDSTKS